MKILARFILRNAAAVALVGTLLGIVGGYYSTQLFRNLRTDLEELLPTTARSVLDLGEVTRRLESVDNLSILVFCDDPDAGRRFVDDLAARLKQAPRDTITSVEYRIDRELEFFRKRRALYIELSDLRELRDFVRKKIQYEVSLYNPFTLFNSAAAVEPQLDLSGMQRKYDTQVSSYSRFPSGYYATPDGKRRVILAYMPGKSSGVGSIHKIKDYVVRAVGELNPPSYHPSLEVKYTGGVQNTLEEQAALVADLELSTIIVMVVVTLAMVIYYRAWLSPLALLVSLLMGTAWTFGVSYFVVGYLNANSAFLGSIVIGNGINFGIILLSRYTEELRKRKSHERSITIALSHTATATWTAALAAGLAYGSLMLTGFRGFNQFGVIGLMGMVLCWLSAFTLLPAYLSLLRRWIVPAALKPTRTGRFGSWLADQVRAHPRKLWAASFGLTLVSAAMFVRFDPDTIIQADLRKLRNKTSMEQGSGYLSRYVDEIFQRYLTPLVILPHSVEQARQIEARLEQARQAPGVGRLIASIQSLDRFVPADQEQKISLLKEIRDSLPDRVRSQLDSKEQRLASEFLTTEAERPIRISDLPQLVRSKFTERDGSVGRMVLVTPPVTKEINEKNNLLALIRLLRETADSVEPGIPVAGGLAISADMIESISRDGPKATLFAFLAVVMLVVFVFRNPRTVLLILGALILGVVWLFGILLASGMKINFLNFIAFPITFGIGVDYGVNIFQRYREEGGKNIGSVIRDTGGAVALCSFTTIVGYGSLIVAENQAFVSFGWLAILGEFTCLAAAILALPAYLLLSEERQASRAGTRAGALRVSQGSR